MPAGIPGPYEVGAKDGNIYFKVLPPSPALINGYRMLLEARALFQRAGTVTTDPAAKLDWNARAGVCDLVVKQVSDGAKRVAALTAAESIVLIRGWIDSTQLRPDPPNKFGARLRDSLKSRPIPGALGTLEVGIADVSVLDAAVGEDGAPYWRAQEFGATHMVNRRIKGLFQPGGAAPSSAMFRTHPIFEVGAVGARPMLIQRPIPEKAFLRQGALEAEMFRQRSFQVVEQAAIAELRLVQTGAHPMISKVRRVIR